MFRNKRYIVDARKKLLSDIGVPDAVEFLPDEFQLEAIQSLKDGHDTLVIAPTGAGKTYIAVEGIREVVSQGKRAVYTGPLKALSNAKYAEFKKKFEPGFSVGLLTGDRKIEGDSDIVVATTEIYRNELYSRNDTYGLVVLDEFHYLADAQRGPVWEESVILSSSSSTLLMLSASISNDHEVADWISEVRKKKVNVIKVTERPVELRLAFLHPKEGIVPLEEDDGKIFSAVRNFYTRSDKGGSSSNNRGRKGKNNKNESERKGQRSSRRRRK